MAKKQVNVALIGYQFMGKAHSNAYRQVGRFFDLDVEPVMKVLCGRSEKKVAAAAENFGWQEYATNWEDVIGRSDIDLVDIGSRYYTFQATMLYCLEACAAVSLPVVVLDRPNPTGLIDVEGPTVRPGFESFVGVHPICTRHGMTIGELAKLYQAERVPGVDLTVIPCHATREQGVFLLHPTDFAVPPSPNMPTLKTAHVYPGMCLIEGTNLSEGRGTTRPFEYVGFPDVNPSRLVERLRAAELPGVVFLPATFRPTFQKHAGKSCGGCLIAIDDYDEFRPVRTGLAVLIAFRELLGDAFQWRTERYEFVDHIPAIDLLFGSDRERLAIEAGASWQNISAAWESEEADFQERRKPHLLYPE